ncbi:MAG: ATP synthase subunit I [Acidobacteriota bacterium]|nr:ATP synthase subunit I [Acidobacteriota bacterium]
MNLRPSEPDTERLFKRLAKFMLLLGVAGIIGAGVARGWPAGVGFAIGAAASWWNFRSLRDVVKSLGTAGSSGTPGAFAWILFRFIILAMGAFVILRFTKISLYAALAGLFVPVGAVILEAIFELTYAR